MALQINQPFPMFFDRDGSPLDNGYIYIGTANANPETSPITVYWDDALTLPASQPLRTINGHISRSGTPAVVFSSADSMSVTSKDSRLQQIIYSPSVASASLASVAAAAASAAAAANSAVAADASADAAAVTAASVLTQAQMEDYLAKMRVPVGNVVMMAQGTPPFGYLECNGAAVSRTTYDVLFAAIGTTYGVGDGVNTFNVPDCRAEFPRGWDHGRGVDIGRALGSTQVEMIKGHEHTLQLAGVMGSAAAGSVSVDRRDTDSIGTATMGTGNKAIASANTETRPINIAFMFCIKAFDSVSSEVTQNYNQSPVTAISSSAGILNIDLTLGNYFTVTLTENITSITFSGLPGSGFGTTIMVRITQGAVAYTVTWPASFRWEGSAPAVSIIPASIDLLGASTFDNGAKWDATISKGRA